MDKLKVGITGQAGFLGTHLYNTLGLYPDEFERIPFEDDFFKDIKELYEFVKRCDVIVHLAAMNRHNDPEVIYETNISLVEKLIEALDTAGNKPHVIFSSSIQEERDNMYGRSKREGREMIAKWAGSNNALFSGLVFPNLFGPFGEPFYNSFITTFSYQLTNNQEPNIETDASIPLLYVNDAVKTIINVIRNKRSSDKIEVHYSGEYLVSDILDILKVYKIEYFENGLIPLLNEAFEINLFNTFRSFIDQKAHNPVNLKLNTDDRGSFVETVRTHLGGQFSFSTTLPGITRGNHFHTRKIERFAVIKGKAVIRMRRIGKEEKLEFSLDGTQPSFVDMPVWYTHNITNVGDEDLYTLFWVNEFFDPEDPDTYYEEV